MSDRYYVSEDRWNNYWLVMDRTTGRTVKMMPDYAEVEGYPDDGRDDAEAYAMRLNKMWATEQAAERERKWAVKITETDREHQAALAERLRQRHGTTAFAGILATENGLRWIAGYTNDEGLQVTMRGYTAEQAWERLKGSAK